MSSFRCLQCGSKEGTPREDETEDWWWWVVKYGKVGPFHEPACLYEFRFQDAHNRFTIPEFNRMMFQRDRLADEVRRQIEVEA